MIRRYIFGTIAATLVLAFAAVTVSAQVGELRGHVFFQKADGTKEPLADAQIDVFRTDSKGEYHTKTNKKGEYVFAGLPFIGEYTIAASHPTASPNWVSKFKVGRGIMADITVTPGDGRRPTFEDIKNATPSGGAAPGGGRNSGESAEERAKREELIRKNKEIEESNKKITEANEIINRTFKAGNDALNAASVSAKNGNTEEAIQKFTEAITQYNEGLAADADQPALLTNKATALKARAIERFNSAIRAKDLDDAAKNAAFETAKNDFREAATSANKAVQLIKGLTAPTDPAEVQRFNLNKYAAMATNAETMRLFVSKVDGSKADEGLAAFREYIAVETDPAKKAKAQLDAAQMLLDAGAADRALTEFQTILATQPDNPDANLGAGLAVYATGDKAKFQEAANYLQHFVDVAPDSHPMKTDAKAILTEMKNTEKIVPEKTPARPRKRP
ncbi:MAG TPA: carboxypeptidase regulatory-like domain-containing protein [Pyrinomonadaceae bacterium]|nr:carboxypeptidase regulatory-like domain-containing protein [Pyrinomonadaceae bacterium]